MLLLWINKLEVLIFMDKYFEKFFGINRVDCCLKDYFVIGWDILVLRLFEVKGG